VIARAFLLVVVPAFVVCAICAIASCGIEPADNRIGINTPDRTQFEPVANLLDHRCGSLDCHGNRQRNLVMFGCEGLRLDPDDAGLLPGCRRQRSGGVDTTQTEFDATYRSLVGLEPAVMSAVVAGKGQHPELLTFVRKARGDEAHKGGTLFTPGDVQDNCVASWLAGATDKDACNNALQNSP
jgi:hypothetical protein